MADLITATSSKGKVTVTETNLKIRLAGSERSIAKSMISDISIGLGLWYGVGFLRTLRISVQGERWPIVLGNMRKSKAQAIMAALGF